MFKSLAVKRVAEKKAIQADTVPTRSWSAAVDVKAGSSTVPRSVSVFEIIFGMVQGSIRAMDASSGYVLTAKPVNALEFRADASEHTGTFETRLHAKMDW